MCGEKCALQNQLTLQDNTRKWFANFNKKRVYNAHENNNIHSQKIMSQRSSILIIKDLDITSLNIGARKGTKAINILILQEHLMAEMKLRMLYMLLTYEVAMEDEQHV